MSLPVIILLLGVVLTSALDTDDLEPLQENQYQLFDYHNEVGVPLAKKIRVAEALDGSRIVGGRAASLVQYPYLGGLVITLTDGKTSVCGSSLLSNTKAVTAARCWRTQLAQARQFEVVLGSVRLFSGGVRLMTTDVVPHPNYNIVSLANDIAMITIPKVEYSSFITPVALPTGALLNNDFSGSWATAVGYGAFGDGVPITNDQVVSHADVQVITNQVCFGTYLSIITASNICVSGTGGHTTCGGDTGGPLVIRIEGQDILIGVISFGHRDGCILGFPTACSRVTSYITWINAQM